MRAERQAGFTLIEILVAFTVAALLLGAIYEIFSSGMRAAALGQRMSEALLLAQSSLDAVSGVPVAPGQTTEQIDSYERVTDVQARPDLLPASAQISVIPYEIIVQVTWQDGVRQRAVALSTLWMGPPLSALSGQAAP